MKIFRLLWYFLRSAVLRGLVNTLKMGALELKHERAFGIRTAATGNQRDNDYYHYQGAGYGIIIRIFTDLVRGREHFSFYDIGCGKGRAVIVAENCGFRNITGIELYDDLLKVAAENLRTYPSKRADSRITLIRANAVTFEYRNEPAVYFLFNPFGENVLREVLLKIMQATRSETYFIYMNPRFQKVFAELAINKHRVYKTRFYTEAIVYHLAGQS